MTTFKLLAGLGMTVVLLQIPGARLGFLHRVDPTAQPVQPGRARKTADISRAEVLLRSLRPDLDASSSGATTAPMSEQ